MVDLLGAQPTRALFLGFPPDDSKDLGLRNRKAHIIPNAEQYGARAASLLYDKRSALILDTAKQLAEIRPRAASLLSQWFVS